MTRALPLEKEVPLHQKIQKRFAYSWRLALLLLLPPLFVLLALLPLVAANHSVPRSILLAWGRASSFPAHTLHISAEDLAQLSSKGATDDSNFQRPTVVYVTVPIVTVCLGICSLYCYLQWKKSLIRKREDKLEKVAQRRRRVSIKQAAAAALAGSAQASNLLVTSAPPAVLGLTTKVDIVDKMILEYKSLHCGVSLPQHHLVSVNNEMYNVTINPLYNSLQSGACGYVRSGAEVKNKALAIAKETHHRSTLPINFQNTPLNNLLAKARVSSNKKDMEEINAKDRSWSIPLQSTQREDRPQSKTRGQSLPTMPVHDPIKSTSPRSLSRLSQVSTSTIAATPRSPLICSVPAEYKNETAKSIGFRSGDNGFVLCSSKATDEGTRSNLSTLEDVGSPTITKFMQYLALSPAPP